jgi:hypothetical protein
LNPNLDDEQSELLITGICQFMEPLVGVPCTAMRTLQESSVHIMAFFDSGTKEGFHQHSSFCREDTGMVREFERVCKWDVWNDKGSSNRIWSHL